MEIRKILKTNYLIAQTNRKVLADEYIINVRNIMEFREEYLYIDDEYLREQKEKLDKYSTNPIFNFHLIIGSREFTFDRDNRFEHYAVNKDINKRLDYKEWIIQRLVE